jgi:class 3 adenylate cyclase
VAVVELQQALEAHRWPGGEQVRVRMGVHTGEAAKTATGLVGLDVHRAGWDTQQRAPVRPAAP